jgi:multiple sugar transport system substrate-binding protein
LRLAVAAGGINGTQTPPGAAGLAGGQNRMFARRGSAAALAAAALFIAACGGGSSDSSSSGSGSGGSGAASTGATSGAQKAPTLAESKGAKGTVTYCTGKDTSGGQAASVKEFNARFASQGLKAKLLEFPTSADEQRSQFVQRQQAKSGECDIFYSDVIWTAEFASQKWLLDMSDYVNSRKSEFIPSTLSTIQFDGKYWGAPKQTDAAFLYYRSDKISQVPSTWQAVYQAAQKQGGIVYQGASYEGLTCDYLELAFAAGGKVLSDDGKKSEINSPENLKALQFMVDGVKSGAAPKAVTTYMEEESRRAFESGKPAFMRNWPYAYALGTKAPKIKGKFKVAPFPAFEGGGKAGILGGHDLVISAFSKNPKGAVALIDYLTGPDAEKRDAAQYSLAPVLQATYDDPAVQKALPFASELKQAVSQAKSRPVSPVYPQISQAIYKNVNAALSGQMSPQDALSKADGQINQALKTF